MVLNVPREAADAVVFDLSMPEMDGVELARRIRQRAPWEDVGFASLLLAHFGRAADRYAGGSDPAVGSKLTPPGKGQASWRLARR